MAHEGGCSFCALDVLPVSKSRSSGKKILVVGRDGRLEVLMLEGGQARLIGTLTGLNGRVLNAKILTWASGVDPLTSSRPLIAVTIYGPVPQEEVDRSPTNVSDNADLLSGISVRRDVYPSRAESPHMQTRVQVFSLKTQDSMATLFATKPEPCYTAVRGTSPVVPPPSGDLKLYASGNYLVVASGVSGEVFIFGVNANPSSGPFCCLGKTWTSVRMRDSRRYSNSSASTTTEDSQFEYGRAASSTDMPTLSLSGRWLAVVPPAPSRTSIRGTVHSPVSQKRLYEIDAHNPPSRPAVTCAVDCDQGSFFNRLARGVTQEFWRGATWTGGQVAQTWNSYFNKDTQTNPISLAPTAQAYETPHVNLLPPTHAQETQQPAAKEPDLVSIIDLRRLEDENVKSSTTVPIAVFQPPDGCTHVSLSPNGLLLFTASRKGDVQHVWDLMQMRYCRARPLIFEDIASAPNPHGLAAHVREVAKFDRLTTTSVLDVQWTRPNGERLAIVTKNGTVHLYEIPRAAFHWPPLRRVQRQSMSQNQTNEGPSREDATESAVGGRISSAVKVIGGTTQPLIAAFRGRAPSVGAAFVAGTGFGLASSRGGKVIASGLSKSVGAATETVNALRHFGENRLHLGNFARDGSVSRLVWLGDEKDPLLGIVDGEVFKVYQIRRGSTGKKKQDQSVFGPKVREIRLPSSLRIPLGPSQALLALDSPAPTGNWTLPMPQHTQNSGNRRAPPLSQAEIETNAPYQPFHTDRRVNLILYPRKYMNGDDSARPWVFGDSIPQVKLQVHGHGNENDSAGDLQPDNGEMENLVSLGSGGANVEYAVITTRRKKKSALGDASGAGGGGGNDDDGFFEDDCDILDFASDRV